MSELLKLIEQEIPEGRQSLQENFNNLEKVAQYCQENYIQASDKKKALEETKNFTTHSLASVAYQINNLATNFLKLLDLQQNQLAETESNVNHLAQTVNIHKEKVARREIGVITTNKSTTRPLGVKNGIIFPEHGERPTKYVRKNIDFTQLDDIGHGVKTHIISGANPTPSRSSSVSSGSTPAPSQQPPTPPQNRNQGSIGRAGGQQIQGPYRTPAPIVAPPTVPSHYASMQQMQDQQLQQRTSGAYAPSTPPVMMGQMRAPSGMLPPGQMGMGMGPPVGMAMPMSQQQGGMPFPPPQGVGMRNSQGPGPRGSQQMQQELRMSQMQRQTSIDILPPPPPDDDDELPPPDDENSIAGGPPPPPPPQFEDDQYPVQDEDPYAATGPEMFSNAFVPDHYLEKVIAIYDYTADKEDELSFSENSVIYVVKKNDDGWFEGVLNGQTGLFPGNYVEPCI